MKMYCSEDPTTYSETTIKMKEMLQNQKKQNNLFPC